MPYPRIDPARIAVLPLSQRRSYIQIETAAIDPDAPPPDPGRLSPQIDRLADALRAARQRDASRMLTYGAHVVKNGCALLINWLLEHGWVTHLATQGAGIIHDVEFGLTGVSSESVRDNAPVGRFGTWDETGRYINLAALIGAARGMGLGESVGKLMADQGVTLPTTDELREKIANAPGAPHTAALADLLRAIVEHRLPTTPDRIPFEAKCGRFSVTQTAYEHRVPLTVHPGIGYDIFACHPMFHGGAIGRTSAADFHTFAESARNLTHGVYMSVGSAIMSPQVFEKAFSVANNLRQQAGEPFVTNHYLAVVDIQEGGQWDWSQGEPPMDSPAYYLRWCKTFARMGGTMDYLQADNRVLLHNLVARLREG